MVLSRRWILALLQTQWLKWSPKSLILVPSVQRILFPSPFDKLHVIYWGEFPTDRLHSRCRIIPRMRSGRCPQTNFKDMNILIIIISSNSNSLIFPFLRNMQNSVFAILFWGLGYTSTRGHVIIMKQNVFIFSARGKGRGRSRNEDEENGAGGKPSGPSTLFDFLESKMGVLSIQGEKTRLIFLLVASVCYWGP